MDLVNAIAKVRFNSARPQRVQLGRSRQFACELVCLEPGQEVAGTQRCSYYVVAGNGLVKTAAGPKDVTLGHFLCFEEGDSHILVNSSDQRMICLAVS